MKSFERIKARVAGYHYAVGNLSMARKIACELLKSADPRAQIRAAELIQLIAIDRLKSLKAEEEVG